MPLPFCPKRSFKIATYLKSKVFYFRLKCLAPTTRHKIPNLIKQTALLYLNYRLHTTKNEKSHVPVHTISKQKLSHNSGCYADNWMKLSGKMRYHCSHLTKKKKKNPATPSRIIAVFLFAPVFPFAPVSPRRIYNVPTATTPQTTTITRC